MLQTYFQQLYDWAVKMIKDGKHMTVSHLRIWLAKGTQPGVDGPTVIVLLKKIYFI
jgi:hypothetical protein